jgi:two-component system alkaline phosphatase synthesis response regulator PhoP
MAKKILLVDDDPDMIEAVKLQLNAAGLETVEAYNGEEGLAKARSENPDLIVLDVMMPVKDGYTAAKEIAEDDNLSEIPVIMLTAVTDHVGSTSYSHQSGKDLMADDFFKKPVNPDELVQRIKELVED